MEVTNMSKKAQDVYERYGHSFVTDTQLSEYLRLGAITHDEYDLIYASKHPAESTES